MFGLGGIFVEALDDVVFRLAPVRRAEAIEMIGEIRAHRLLAALRGRPGADVDALALVIVRVSELPAERPEIAELDLNPCSPSRAGPRWPTPGSCSPEMRRRRDWSTLILLAPPLAFLLVIFAVPLARVVWGSFFAPDFTLEHYRRMGRCRSTAACSGSR